MSWYSDTCRGTLCGTRMPDKRNDRSAQMNVDGGVALRCRQIICAPSCVDDAQHFPALLVLRVMMMKNDDEN